MQLIEPCCTQKHWPSLRSQVGESGFVLFHGYGDLSLVELLPVILTSYSSTELMIVCPRLPDGAAQAISSWMKKQWARMDGKGNVDVIAHLTLVTDLRDSKSPLASTWLKENHFGKRLTLINVQQNDTAIILPDIALYGNINLVYGGHFSAIVTKNAKTIQSLREMYQALT